MDRELRELHQGAREERRRLVPDPGPCFPGRPESPRKTLEADRSAIVHEDLDLERYDHDEYALVDPEQRIHLDRTDIKHMAELAGFEVSDE